MRDAHPRKIQFYCTENGREPFTEWFHSIQDQRTQTSVVSKLTGIKIASTARSYSKNGTRHPKTKLYTHHLELDKGFRSELGSLRLAILAIIALLAMVSLNSASTLELAIASTLVK